MSHTRQPIIDANDFHTQPHNLLPTLSPADAHSGLGTHHPHFMKPQWFTPENVELLRYFMRHRILTLFTEQFKSVIMPATEGIVEAEPLPPCSSAPGPGSGIGKDASPGSWPLPDTAGRAEAAPAKDMAGGSGFTDVPKSDSTHAVVWAYVNTDSDDSASQHHPVHTRTHSYAKQNHMLLEMAAYSNLAQ